jgi:hypothetical protein
MAGTSDDVDFADHVVALLLGRDRLVVATAKQSSVQRRRHGREHGEPALLST